MAIDAAGERSDSLDDFGHNQQLDRSIGRFASFAAGVGIIVTVAAVALASWHLQYGAILFIGIVFFGGLAHCRLQRHNEGVLAFHAAAPAGSRASTP